MGERIALKRVVRIVGLELLEDPEVREASRWTPDAIMTLWPDDLERAYFPSWARSHSNQPPSVTTPPGRERET